MESNELQFLLPGAEVAISPDKFTATIIATLISGDMNIRYQVAYWQESTRVVCWISPCEIEMFGRAAQTMRIGFPEAPPEEEEEPKEDVA